MTKPYRFVEDVFQDLIQIRALLAARGALGAVKLLDGLQSQATVNPVDAVNQIILSLEQVHTDCERLLEPTEVWQVDCVLRGARRLYGTP